MQDIDATNKPPEITMNMLSRTRLDNVLNAMLIVVGLSAIVTIAFDGTATDKTALTARNAATPVAAKTATEPAAPAAKIVASVQLQDPR